MKWNMRLRFYGDIIKVVSSVNLEKNENNIDVKKLKNCFFFSLKSAHFEIKKAIRPCNYF